MFALLDRLATAYIHWRTRQSMRAYGVPASEADAVIKRANMTEKEIQAVAEHTAIAILADELDAFYDKLAGPNFLELKFWGPKGPLVMVISRPGPGVKTQGDIIQELKAELSLSNSTIRYLEERLSSNPQPFYVDCPNCGALMVELDAEEAAGMHSGMTENCPSCGQPIVFGVFSVNEWQHLWEKECTGDH